MIKIFLVVILANIVANILTLVGLYFVFKRWVNGDIQ